MKTKNKLVGSTSREKMPPRPKPEFTTDFVDREKYKLSETEMIQKKAALQSKHRQQAIEELQQRRKKLEMGIIDDDTRKVYETALTSKKIDLNPNIRKNLSQMIQYQREKQKEIEKERKEDDQNYPAQAEKQQCGDSQQEYEKELKEAQAFIKKFEKAKKMDKIERAVNLLTEDNKSSSLTKPSPKATNKSKEKSKEKKPIFENPCINNNILKNSSTSLNTSTNEEILSNIEDTIRFMEERLFSAGRIDKLKKQQKSKEQMQQNSRANPIKTSYSDIPCKSNQTLGNFEQTKGNNFYRQTLQISHLKVSQDHSDNQSDCLDTIRRMKEMIDIEESLRQQPNFKRNMKENIDFGNTVSNRPLDQFSTVQKQTPHHTESDAEIDFSLTINNSQLHSLQNSGRDRQSNWMNFAHKQEKTQNNDDEYERIKKSLFEEVNRLQLHSIHESEPSIQAKTHEKAYEMIDESSIPNLRCMPTPSPITPSPITNKKEKKGNLQLQRLKNQISGTKSNVQAIKVQSLPARSEVIGIDFRGSFNIKKNIVQQ